MKDFADEHYFEHVTSSPRYPQSNDEAERAVRTVKTLLKKVRDPYRALLAYMTTLLGMYHLTNASRGFAAMCAISGPVVSCGEGEKDETNRMFQ